MLHESLVLRTARDNAKEHKGVWNYVHGSATEDTAATNELGMSLMSKPISRRQRVDYLYGLGLDLVRSCIEALRNYHVDDLPSV